MLNSDLYLVFENLGLLYIVICCKVHCKIVVSYMYLNFNFNKNQYNLYFKDFTFWDIYI